MKKNIAIIGSGVSGLTCGYLLSQKHQVTVFEKNDYIGGHTATKDVSVDGKDYVVDTGFIVFNNKTYPNFLKLIAQLGVNKRETEMSFSVHNRHTQMEFNGHNLDTLFAQRSNILKPSFWRLILEILRFNKQCKKLYASGDIPMDKTLGQFLNEEGFSDHFSQHYILPMGAAIWSSSIEQMMDFQLDFFIRFFHNHGLLNIADRPQWYVIENGSRAYIEPLIKAFKDNIHLNTDITGVYREQDQVKITFADGSEQFFDDVVLACHSDQALALLKDASEDEQQVLGALPYSQNQVVMHTDVSVLPKRRKAWASWNYMLDNDRQRPASVSYNMNILQHIESDHTFCVTLNQSDAVDKDKLLEEYVYEHPIFSTPGMAAQQQRHQICGQNRTHFAGAYWYNGFHEDGVRSAVDVGERFGCQL
ncbi:NAD(P)/FAD-dependent oxidoreductase [Thalassotalea sp. PS06]|uniref:NAD(P)/FAD-dependent oxidoreductase n=1 Tax=Thalassotalea sp. PS06 TaxID=2594005 RepID=UPI001162D74C|nr:FAD-dependent oxidoreductase [Thalassotalea sp. PS06]QDP02138.1 FAD-dependent oxidoreductase [Thalassotalea sp. PS06]